MKINLKKKANSTTDFTAKNQLGHQIELCNSTQENPTSPSPMELILMGVAGCSSIDIVHILEKQNLQLDDLDVAVEGLRNETIPKVFNTIDLSIKMKGEIPENKAKRAVQLSFDKYCSVSKMLEKSVKINYKIELNGELI
ncbi:MAG: OsmC family protein [Bacteroidota bacterium]